MNGGGDDIFVHADAMQAAKVKLEDSVGKIVKRESVEQEEKHGKKAKKTETVDI